MFVFKSNRILALYIVYITNSIFVNSINKGNILKKKLNTFFSEFLSINCIV